MSQTIQIECPNCQTINNVKKEEPLTEDDCDIVFDCGKCNVEVAFCGTFAISDETIENKGEENEV